MYGRLRAFFAPALLVIMQHGLCLPFFEKLHVALADPVGPVAPCGICHQGIRVQADCCAILPQALQNELAGGVQIVEAHDVDRPVPCGAHKGGQGMFKGGCHLVLGKPCCGQIVFVQKRQVVFPSLPQGLQELCSLGQDLVVAGKHVLWQDVAAKHLVHKACDLLAPGKEAVQIHGGEHVLRLALVEHVYGLPDKVHAIEDRGLSRGGALHFLVPELDKLR